MSIQEELELNIKDMNKKLNSNQELSSDELKILLLSNLIEEEGKK